MTLVMLEALVHERHRVEPSEPSVPVFVVDAGQACESPPPETVLLDPWSCPRCRGEMRVIDSRQLRGYIRRRRRCLRCTFAFTTREVVDR